MVVLSPCDTIEAKKGYFGLRKRRKIQRIFVFLRNGNTNLTTEETPFEIGKAQLIFIPEVGLASVGIIATGAILYKCNIGR
jgi:transketolase C-terminal domain/subunit